MPEVSVCIPVYGVEKYIERCARSLFEQTMSDGIEFIFVDDCTRDRSIEILEEILKEYPQRQSRTRIIRHEKNGGLVAARNTALKHASGKYIVHCDSDDWVDTDLYEKMYRKALAEGADMVCVPFASEIPGGRGAEMIFPVEAAEPADYIAKNLGSHLNSLCSKMYKREIALAPDLEVPEQISMGEDLLRNTQMLGKCRKISFVTDSCYHYRCNASSITHTFAEKHYRNMKGILDILQQKDPAGYSGVILYIRTVTLLALLRNIHKDPALKPLFTKEWRSTSFKERMKMIFTAPNTLKGRVVLSIVCISKSLAFALLKRLYQSECR